MINRDEVYLMELIKGIKDEINTGLLTNEAVNCLKGIRKQLKKKLFKIREQTLLNPSFGLTFEYVNATTVKVVIKNNLDNIIVNTVLGVHNGPSNTITQILTSLYNAGVNIVGQDYVVMFTNVLERIAKGELKKDYVKVFKNETK